MWQAASWRDAAGAASPAIPTLLMPPPRRHSVDGLSGPSQDPYSSSIGIAAAFIDDCLAQQTFGVSHDSTPGGFSKD